MRPMQTIMIANRGEIAARIIRTARNTGYRTIAVYSEADQGAPYVAMADRCIALGPGAATATYLDQAKLIAAAIAAGADAIHPGYGFLAEHAGFAQACAHANIIFIGPRPETIALMGDKAQAKAHMRRHNVPIVPGYDGADQSNDTLIAQAAALGPPLLIKAVAGGGGRGMREVNDLANLHEALVAARREAFASFGDDRLMLEKRIDNGRHIEVQICGDQFGTILHLGDRDCTTQRRRQKIIEEAPAASLSSSVRNALHRAAVHAARSVNYLGVGTVEFILDPSDQFYFLEMNTRIQVEHTITEAITGIDLIDWQLRIATGEALPARQDDIITTGHAIEARICAEDPDHDFAPQTGTIRYWRPPQNMPGVRCDAGISEGAVITPLYDSMLAKIIAHGRDRPQAIRRLQAALSQSPIFGLTTNIDLLIDLLASPAFQSHGLRVDTLDHWRPPQRNNPLSQHALIWALAAALHAGIDRHGQFNRPPAPRHLTLSSADQRRDCVITKINQDWRITLDEHDFIITELTRQDTTLRYIANGVGGSAIVLEHDESITLCVDGHSRNFQECGGAQDRKPKERDPEIRAPLSGRLVMCAREGDELRTGDKLAIIEAMKMETAITAPAPCRIIHGAHDVNAQITRGAVLVTVAYCIEPEATHG
jgi:geranyl-CoA carboxylase alpha subunit